MAKLFAYLSYRDAGAAIEWLEAIGFEVTTRQDGEQGVMHAELALGDAAVMLATADEPYEVPALKGRSTGHGLYLLVEDVRGAHSAAVRAERARA